MPIHSPFHERTSALCTSLRWKEWAGIAAVCSYDTSADPEYFALRHCAALLDVSPLYKYDIEGPEAARFLAMVVCRDITRLRERGVVYTCWCDEAGKVLDDGTIARIGPHRFRLTSSEPWFGWLRRNAAGFDVAIEDSTDRIAALALQGPLSRHVLADVLDHHLKRLGYFRLIHSRLGDIPVTVSRTGYTGDLGYELWFDRAHALPVWDALMAAGERYRMLPMGLDALDMARLEAGYILQGIDYTSARSCEIEAQKSTPWECGLGDCVDLDRDWFIGQEALRASRAKPAEKLVCLQIDWEPLEALYARYGLVPHLPAGAWRDGVPIYSGRGRNQVGRATSGTWSPLLKQNIALATLDHAFCQPGDTVWIEHTVEYERHLLPARIVQRGLYDPPRRRARPVDRLPGWELLREGERA